jgi:hypothetical protein
MLKELLVRNVRKIAPFAFLDPEGEKGINKCGHREYIGGNWEEIGTLQFEFLKSQGLRPDSYLLDIACGALRLGVKAIPFLEPEHYLGIEKEPGLIAAGLGTELDKKIRNAKRPRLVISDAFEFSKLGQKADFAIAQSLFTHLPPPLIHHCFANLLPWLENNGVFFATYFEVERPRKNPAKPHAHGYFAYSKAEMLAFGASNDFRARYIGNWNHPADQVMVEYRGL